MPGPRVLAQSPGTGALVDLYAVPASTGTIVSTLVISNTTSSPQTVRVTVSPTGAADTAAHTVVDLEVPPRDRLSLTEGWGLAPTSVIRYNGPAGCPLTAFGTEIAQ